MFQLIIINYSEVLKENIKEHNIILLKKVIIENDIINDKIDSELNLCR